MSEKVRVQKFLSQKGLFSRRQVEDFIRSGRLEINYQKASLGDRVSEEDIILLDGEVLSIPENVEKVVIAFYKPKGVETTLKKLEGKKTLADFDFRAGRVFPIGRLDKDSQGLLLLTNDGDLANRMMHPRYGKTKEYLVALDKNVDQEFCSKIEKGILIGRKKTAPCRCEIVDSSIVRIVLKEGRNRQIRRMCEVLGYEVVDLLRIRFGGVELGNLKPGKFRKISRKFLEK